MDKKNLIAYIQQVIPVAGQKVEEIVSHFQQIYISRRTAILFVKVKHATSICSWKAAS